MFSKAVLAIAALGVVSVWYARSRSPFDMARSSRQRPDADPAPLLATPSQNVAEDLQHSHAMGVAGGIEGPQAAGAEGQAPAAEVQPDQAAWPASREFLRGA